MSQASEGRLLTQHLISCGISGWRPKVRLLKEVAWDGWEELATNIKYRGLHPSFKKTHGTYGTYSGWWFQILVIFNPYLGKMSILTDIFQSG